MDLRKKTYHAMFWSLIDRGGEQALRFILGIILARLLLPEHFGLIGMAFVVTELARVFVQAGFGLALINNREATKTDECSVFYFNVIIGALATLLIFLLAPAIGTFYKSPPLVPILRILSISVFIGAFGSIQSVLLTKEIEFKAQTIVGLPSTFISGVVGIALAYKGYGVWALVVQSIIRTTLSTVLIWYAHSWRPCLQFSLSSLKKLFGFGSKLLLGSIVQMLFDNTYVILIGRLFPPAQLGFYTRAKQTQQVPIDSIWAIIDRVSYPVLSTLKNDTLKMRSALKKGSDCIALIVFPSLAIAALVAPKLFLVLFGERWAPSVPMFQILCLSSMFLPLEHIRYSTILAQGNSGLHFLLQLAKNSLIVLSAILSYSYGINAMLICYGIISYLSFCLAAYFVGRRIGYPLIEQCIDLLPCTLCTFLSWLSAYLILQLHIKGAFYSLLAPMVTGVLIFILAGRIIRLNALMEIITYLRSMLLHKSSLFKPWQA